MMSLKAFRAGSIKSGGAKAARYYCSEVYYKDEGHQLSQWFGKGAEKLGLINQQMNEKMLADVLDGQLPNGVQVGLMANGEIKHRPGMDLCFSAPKSISVLTQVCGMDKFKSMFMDSVKYTLGIIERDCAHVRVRSKEGFSFERTDNLTFAIMVHGLSRKLDPDFHAHCLAMNFTERSNGEWRALASDINKNGRSAVVNGFRERIYDHQLYYGMIQSAYFAKLVVNAGYEIENTGKNGLWELKAFPDDIKDLFSKMRKEIEAELATKKTKTNAVKSMVALFTRPQKVHNMDVKALKSAWQDELKQEGGLSVSELVNLVEGQKITKTPSSSKKN